MSEEMSLYEFEGHPIGKAINSLRQRTVASDFSPEYSGQRGEDFDRGLLACAQVVRNALSSTPAPSEPARGGGWLPIAEAKTRCRYMAAFQTPLQMGHWTIVGPGSIRDGVFHNYLGSWPGMEMVFHLPPVLDPPASLRGSER